MQSNEAKWLRGMIYLISAVTAMCFFLYPLQARGDITVVQALAFAMGFFLFLINAMFPIYSGRLEKDRHNVAILKRIAVYDEQGLEVLAEDGGYRVPKKVKLCVYVEGIVDSIYFFQTPSGADFLAEREQIGYLSSGIGDDRRCDFKHGSGMAEFVWELPEEGFTGFFGIEMINANKIRYIADALQIESVG